MEPHLDLELRASTLEALGNGHPFVPLINMSFKKSPLLLTTPGLEDR